MPVDLSTIGLKGIEAAQQTLNSIAMRDSQAQQDQLAQQKADQEQADQQLDKLAVQNTMSILAGKGVDLNDPQVDSDDFAEFFDTLGTQYMKAGAPKRGKDFITAGIDYRKKQADIDKAGDDQDQTRLENMVKAGSWVASNIGDNESEYQLFLHNLDDPNNPVADILGKDNIAVLKNTPWSPELANLFKSKAISVKDQATLALTERGQRRMEQSAADTKAYRDSLLEINRGNLEERKRENRIKDKTGGADVSKVPSPTEHKSALNAIVNNVKVLGGVLPDENTPERTALDNMADNIVGRAKTIFGETKGVTFSEAIEQAVAESEKAGDFGIIKPAEPDKWYPGDQSKPAEYKYKRKGATPDNPIPLPSGNKAAVRNKLVPGRYYQTPMGTLKWNGTDFDE